VAVKSKKGAKAGFVVFYSPYSYEKEVQQEDGTTITEIKTMPVLKYYNVFHIDDCTGIESKNESKPAKELKPVERAEEIINNYVTREGLRFQNDKESDRACYSPITDRVIVPMLSQYDIVEEYYSTTFHELTHSTMLKNRCDRTNDNILAAFGGDDYSREELVAELGATYLCTESGLDSKKAFKKLRCIPARVVEGTCKR
jgi:antirestriction protein ArdC